MYNLLLVVLSDTLQRLLLKNYSYGWHRFYQSNILAQYLYFFLILGTFDSSAHTHHSCTPGLNLCKIVSQNWFECFDYFFISRKTSFMLVISSKWFKKKNILHTLHTVTLITLSDVHLWKFLSAFYCLWCSQHFLKKWPQITQKLLCVTFKK